MQFLVIAHDGTDGQAPARRQHVRNEHLERAKAAHRDGTVVWGGAILDENGEMIGSTLVLEYPSASDVHEWIATDPYVTGEVWQDITVKPFRLADLG